MHEHMVKQCAGAHAHAGNRPLMVANKPKGRTAYASMPTTQPGGVAHPPLMARTETTGTYRLRPVWIRCVCVCWATLRMNIRVRANPKHTHAKRRQHEAKLPAPIAPIDKNGPLAQNL